jgi:competence protein ComEA
MKTGWAIAFSVVCAFLAAGILYLAASPPRGEAIILLPVPSPLPLVVQVSGAVKQPGVCQLSPGSRVQDALEAAGGPLDGADISALNLAAPVQDGERIEVPAAEVRLASPPQDSAPGFAGSRAQTGVEVGPMTTPTPQGAALPPSTGKINLNTAGQAELESLPGIGPALAQRILDYREQSGPFKTIEDIQKVKGIGPGIFAKIKDLITV